MEKTPRAKNPQKRAAHHEGTTPTSDAKAKTPKDPANGRLPTTNANTGTKDSLPILGNRQPTGARTPGNVAAKLQPNRGRGDRVGN